MLETSFDIVVILGYLKNFMAIRTDGQTNQKQKHFLTLLECVRMFYQQSNVSINQQSNVSINV